MKRIPYSAACRKLLAGAVLLAVGLLTANAAEAAPKTVQFESADGVALSGLWYGEGDHVVVFSHQNNIDQEGWADLAEKLAGVGYAVLTYNFRGYPPSGGAQAIGEIGKDLDAAIGFARQQGATHLVLVGASMGGIVTVPAAVAAHPDAYITMSAPLGFAGLEASDAALAGSPAAKLFINSEHDKGIADTWHMAETASVPKTLAIYPSGLHGVSMFETEAGPSIEQSIVDFIVTNAPL
jgi:alpha/beta superfamily hydrolase